MNASPAIALQPVTADQLDTVEGGALLLVGFALGLAVGIAVGRAL